MGTGGTALAASRADVAQALRAKAAEALVLAECIGSSHDLRVCIPYIQRGLAADADADHLMIDLGARINADAHGPATALMRALDRVTAMARTLTVTQARAVLLLAMQAGDGLRTREGRGQPVDEEQWRTARRGRILAEAFLAFREAIESLEAGAS